MRRVQWVVAVSVLWSVFAAVGVIVDETEGVAPSVKSNAVEIVTRIVGDSFTNSTWRMTSDISTLTWTNYPAFEIAISCTNDRFTVTYATIPETNFWSVYRFNRELMNLYRDRMEPQIVTNQMDALRIASNYACRFGVTDLLDSGKWEYRMIDFSQGKWKVVALRILSNATERVYSDFSTDISFYDDDNSTLNDFFSNLFQIRTMPTNAVLTAAQGRANADALLARLSKWPATGAEFITNRLEFVQPNDIFVKPEGEDLNFDCKREERLIWCNYYSKQPEIPGWRKPQLPMLVYIDAVTGEVCGGSY